MSDEMRANWGQKDGWSRRDDKRYACVTTGAAGLVYGKHGWPYEDIGERACLPGWLMVSIFGDMKKFIRICCI